MKHGRQGDGYFQYEKFVDTIMINDVYLVTSLHIQNNCKVNMSKTKCTQSSKSNNSKNTF